MVSDMDKQKPTLTALEASYLLFLVGVGAVVPRVVGDNWKDTYAGNVDYEVGGWKVSVFNDCDCWDYIDRIEAPDGRWGEYSNWKPLATESGMEFDLPSEPDYILSLASASVSERMTSAFINAT
jgi:hypothetical protein